MRMLLLLTFITAIFHPSRSEAWMPTAYWNKSLHVLAGGLGGGGSIDGFGGVARFKSPNAVAMDSAGNVYVADTQNHLIRKITPAGEVTTLAGSPGTSGSANGTGTAASFQTPFGIAIDSTGNVYVADTYNHTIRKVTAAGAVTTFAGTAESPGSADGTGTAASFQSPNGIAVDSAGNVYVADTLNRTVRKITSTGIVTTLAGLAGTSSGSTDGTGSAARFSRPAAVAVDSAGNVYVADGGNHTIRKITAAGVVTTLAGTASSTGSTNGTGSAARFTVPSGIAVDSSGNVFVADTNNSTIRRITPAGVVTTFAGAANSSGSANGTGGAARFSTPGGVAVDASGNLFVADTYNHVIRKMTSGAVVTTLAGTPSNGGSANGTGSAARFYNPGGLAPDLAGNIFVADSNNNSIRKITSTGVVTTFAGTSGSNGTADGTGSAARFNYPSGIAVDSAGNLYIADKFNSTIRKITSAGAVTTLAGTAGTTGNADGTGTAARFYYPGDVAVDPSGNVYVTDTGNHTIRKITAGGVVTTLAGTAGLAGNANGTGSAARFYDPDGIGLDAAGNIYVADSTNHMIRKITSAGVVTTLAGTTGTPGTADGTGPAARFYYPYGIAVDPTGIVFVGEGMNARVRKISPAGVVTTVVGSRTRDGVRISALPASLGGAANVALRNGRLYLISEGAVLWCPKP